MKVEIHTIRFGNPDWLAVCAPTLDEWTVRHDYPLRIWTKRDNKPEYPHLKFCVVDMWRALLDGNSDWLVYIDGDMYVRHDAPGVTFLTEHTGMLARRSNRRRNGRLDWWCRRYTDPDTATRMQRWSYRNLGWFAIDRDAAEKMLRVVSLPYYEGTMDECQVNYWMAAAVDRHSLTVTSPPREWHRFFWERGPGWMWHLARKNGKMTHLERIRREGKIATCPAASGAP